MKNRKVTVNLVAGSNRHGAIGIGDKLPWHCKADMAHFRKLTGGGMVVMGRKTWEGLPETYRPLPGRFNAILSRQYPIEEYKEHELVAVVREIEQAIDECAGRELFIIGGAEIYRQVLALDLVDVVYLTVLSYDIDPNIGDVVKVQELVPFIEDTVDKTKWYSTGSKIMDSKDPLHPILLTYKRIGKRN